jgi:Histidine kinase-like ATPase domain/PilZ domain
VDYDGARCQWSLTDEGAGFDYEQRLSRPEPAPEDMWAASGRGILLMRAMIDEVRYEAGGRRVLLTLRRPAVTEQRAHARQPLHQPVRVAPIRSDGSVDWDAAYDAVTQNFSRGGLGLLQSQLARAERVLIGMDIDGEIVYVPAQVRHCKPAQGNVLELGCQFILPDDIAGGMWQEGQNLDEAMAKLLAYLHKPILVIDERRQHQRVSYTEPIEITPPGKPTVHAIARDISRSGISLIATEPFPFEAVVIGLPAPQQPVLRVRAQVVRCAVITEGFFDVGARFLGLA